MDIDYGVLVKCDYCLGNFNSLPDLENHIAKEHFQTESKKAAPFDDEEEDYVCTEDYQQVFPIFCRFCEKSFMTENEFNQHNVLEHSNIVEFQDQLPVNEKSLQLQRAPQAVSMCALCRVSFPRVRELAKHVLSNHPVDQLETGQAFTCQLCPEVGFPELKDLENHNSQEHKEMTHSYRCPECRKDFKAARFLRNHIRNHLSQKAFQCSQCRRLFSMEGGMREHLKKCGLKNVSKAAKLKEQLKSALLASEEKRKKDQQSSAPPTEGISGIDVGQLKSLQPDGEEDKGRRFTCKACGGIFKTRILCHQHISQCGRVLADLNENGPRPAEKISTSSTVVKDLKDPQVIAGEEAKIDMSTEQGKPRNHHCQLCEKTFLTLSHLKEHMIQHTGVYPFNCSTCGKGFKRKNVLESHVCSQLKSMEKVKEEEDSADNSHDKIEKIKLVKKLKPEDLKTGENPKEEVDEELEKNIKLDKKINVDEVKVMENPKVKKNEEIDLNIVLPETSRSGRLIKPKKFFEDIQKEEKRRPRKRPGKSLLESSEESRGVSRRKRFIQALLSLVEGEKFIVMLGQLPYAIKNQLKAPKAPY